MAPRMQYGQRPLWNVFWQWLAARSKFPQIHQLNNDAARVDITCTGNGNRTQTDKDPDAIICPDRDNCFLPLLRHVDHHVGYKKNQGSSQIHALHCLSSHECTITKETAAFFCSSDERISLQSIFSTAFFKKMLILRLPYNLWCDSDCQNTHGLCFPLFHFFRKFQV